MCIESQARIGCHDVEVFMGYYGGDIKVGDVAYSTHKKACGTEHDIINILCMHTKRDIAEMVVELINNAYEI